MNPITADLRSEPAVTVFKGGTAFNSLLREFQSSFPHAAYVVPITDDGGSSREIVRVFGGPSIGDLRSTLTRLSEETTLEACAVKKLLEHRLSSQNEETAKLEWHDFLENLHPLYENISNKYRKLIHCFLCKFESERLRRIDCRLDLRNGNIGNFFLSGIRMTLGSLEAAIFMYSSVARIAAATQVLPIIDCNDRLGISAQLADDSFLIGQHQISHPSDFGQVNKASYQALPAAIKKLFYIDKFKNIINPKPHPEVLQRLSGSQLLIYGMGSLWTSIIPSLVLEGVGEAIAAKHYPKIVLMNACQDRETDNMTGLDYIHNIVTSLNRHGALHYPAKAYITHLFAVEHSPFNVNREALKKLGIKLVIIKADECTRLSLHDRHYPIYHHPALIEMIKHILDKE